jgi:dipeptidyl aminopeptidase/acylaminoacyl peptidase
VESSWGGDRTQQLLNSPSFGRLAAGGKQMAFTGVLTAAIAGLGAVASVVIAFSWVLARVWCNPKREVPSRTPVEDGLPFESTTYSSHGVPINGWLIPVAPATSPPPAVVLTHGWSKNAAEMLPLARLLHQAGLAVLLYDARGHGASGDDGPITVLKFAEDIIASIDYLETRPDVDRTRLGVLGRSIGGAGAILVASTDPRIRAVVSCSAFADPETLTRGHLTQMHIPSWPFTWLVCRFIERWLGGDMDRVAPQNRIGHIAAPILLIHGDADRFVPPSNVDALYARASRERAERLLISGRRHSDVIRDRGCGQR